jgi:alpha-amylase/alpha-mannosidase (GH57 family)
MLPRQKIKMTTYYVKNKKKIVAILDLAVILIFQLDNIVQQQKFQQKSNVQYSIKVSSKISTNKLQEQT